MEPKKMINEAVGSAVLKTTPVGGVAVASLWGFALADWTLILACVVALVQIISALVGIWLKVRNRDKYNEE